MKKVIPLIFSLLALSQSILPAHAIDDSGESSRLVVPSVFSESQNNNIHRAQYPTLEAVIKHQDSLAKRPVHGPELRSNRSLSGYSVGSIPIKESVSPSGGRIYSIPITTAQGWNLSPDISLIYNSQGGNNVAGYGWGIGGLSSITVRNANIYYDGEARGCVYDSTNVKYSLDGVPLVQSEMGLSGYTLCTARGNIQVQKHTNSSGQVLYFTAIYPDGSVARFGFTTNTSPRGEYPISRFTDKDGNNIAFSYTLLGNHYYVDTISYGYDAMLEFSYSARSDCATYAFASFGQASSFPAKRLSSVTCLDGNDVICEYTLSHEWLDGVSLLKEIHCTMGTAELPPLTFSYGIDSDPGVTSNPMFTLVDSLSFFAHFTKSDRLKLQYHRGKLLPANPNDGIVVMTQKDNYARIDSTWFFGWRFKYGSKYASTTQILCDFTRDSSAVQRLLVAEDGFQIIEAIDIDGDGTDELVKINSSVPSRDVTAYKITIYSFNSSYVISSSNFTVTVNDGWHNASYDNPAKSFYRFGNFRGDGRMMLLIMTKQHSKFALVDLNSGMKLCEASLFTFGDDEDNPVLAADFENDGKTDLCHITDSGMDVYSLAEGGSTFSLRTTYSGISKHLLRVEPNYTIDGIPQDVISQLYTVDLNGDGYLDIASAPQLSVNIGGDIFDQTETWNIARFNGKSFSTTCENLYTRTKDDTIIFLDVDEDGLPDMLHQRYSRLYYVPNINGDFTSQHNYSDIAPDPTADLVPGDASLFGTAGDIIVMSGPWVKLYAFSLDHSTRRSIRQLTDSFGNIQENEYRKTGGYSGAYLMDGTRDYSSSLGFSRLRAPFNVLYRVFGYDAYQHTTTNTFYTYWDAVYHSRGLGFCGFGKIRASDYMDDEVSYTVFDPEKFGAATSVSVQKGENGTPYSTVVNTYDSHTTTYGKLNPRLTQSVAVDSLTGITTTTSYSYGDYDLPTQIQTSTAIGSDQPLTQKVKRTYEHSLSPAKFVLGVVKTESIITEADSTNQLAWEEKTVYTYDNNYHPIRSEIYVGKNGFERVPKPDTLIFRAPPGRYEADNLVSTTRRTFDSRGNVTSEKTAPYGATEFVGDTLVYDANGRYLVSKTDALGHTITYSGYNKFGKATTVTDYRGRTTTYTYDNWGNLTQTSYPDGGVEQTTMSWGGDGLYTVTNTATGEPETITHYDALGREIKSGVKRFDGVWQFTNREYDSCGRLSRVSLPYRQTSGVTGPSYWNRYHYDAHDRPDSLIEASGRVSLWSYSGTCVTTVKDSIAITKTTDAMGRVVSVSDLGGTVTYTLRDDGQPSSITAPDNVVTTFTYDDYGRQTQMVDPSLGTESDAYTWNADGSSQFTHANRNGTVTTFKDKYGRTTQVQRANEFNTTYTYDTYGRISSVLSTNGTGKRYTYDALDRIVSVKDSIPGGKWLQKGYYYSAGSVVDSIRYVSHSGYITTERYSYANGHNTGIMLPGNITVWTLTDENDLGQPTEIYTGPIKREYGYTSYGLPFFRKMDQGALQEFSYEFDPKTGNLLSRSGYLPGEESFAYDSLGRLKTITRGQTTRHITFAPNGNITSIDGVGTLIYGGGTGVSPYEVTGLTPEVGQPSYRQRTVTYNSFDRPATISESGYTATLTYNAEGEKVRTFVTGVDGPERDLVYIGGRYEYDSVYGPMERLYLGGDAYSAPMVLVKIGAMFWTPYQIGRDYLGSITQIADLSGNSYAQYRYDPWGRMVNVSTGAPYAPGSEPTLFLGRGFTSHEYLPWFGLINANARLYDPLLGRFLSPDPYVQAPDFSQNYNRYSYCLNNPLKYTDESGEIFGIDDALFAFMSGAIIGALSGGVMAYKSGAQGFEEWASYILSGATIGATAAGFGFTAGLFVSSMTHLGGFIGGALSGMASGAVGGAISGFYNTLLLTSDSSTARRNALLSAGVGALTGGLLGGLGSGYLSKRHGGNFWDGIGESVDYIIDPAHLNELSDPVEYSQTTVDIFSNKNFGPRPKWLSLKADGSIPGSNGYYVGPDGAVYNNQNQALFGTCIRSSKESYTAYIFESACSSKQQLYLTLGHEYYHGYLWRLGINSDVHHEIITEWQVRQSAEWNFNLYDNYRFYSYYHNDPTLGFGMYNYLGLDQLIPIISKWHIL